MRKKNKISLVTRKDLFYELKEKEISWYGRLDEIQFLNRLYDLKKIHSLDSRFDNAEEDIRQHCIRNYDWDYYWIIEDERFNLLSCEDEIFLKFLCEMVHPEVRKEEEVKKMVGIINKYLANDNYELYVKARISNRPVYGYRKKDIAKEKIVESVKTITNYLTSEYINKQLEQIESSIDTNPALAIGTAKELLETICKAILDKNKVETNNKENLPKLLKKTLNTLNLLPEQIPDDKEGAKSIKKIIGGLQSIVNELAHLRNHYGSGHGKSPGFKGLQPRHAKLAVGAAATVIFFLLEAYQKQDKHNNKQ